MLLGVSINHIATVRDVRDMIYPGSVGATLIAEARDVNLTTTHLCEDRRHIRDANVFAVKNAIHTHLNLEVALAEEILENAPNVIPENVYIVPEKRQEVTTEDGLDVLAQQNKMAEFTEVLTDASIRAPLFINADDAQIQAAYDVGAPIIGLHTGAYTDAHDHAGQVKQFECIQNGAHYASNLGLIVSTGYGLTIHNVASIVQVLAIHELNIGHSPTSQTLSLGLPEAAHQMREVVFGARMSS